MQRRWVFFQGEVMQPSSICLTAAATILFAVLLTGCQQQKAPEETHAPQQSDNAAAAPAATQIAGTPSGTVMTPEYVATVARFAYIWGWPLVNNLNRSLGMKDLPGPGRIGGVGPVAPPGQVSMLTDYISADERLVTCPNQDTVYGAGFQHVDTIPVVVQVPDFGNRFFVYQIADARTNSFGSIGKQYGTKPGFYAIVGPNWKGTIPSGITGVLHSPTDLVAAFLRVFQDDTAEDKAAVQPLISQMVMYPLSQFDGKMKTMDWKGTPSFPAPPSTGGETKWVIPERFFDELPIILKQVPPMPGEESLYATFQSLLDAGGNGWNSPPNGANWGYDYLSRAASAKSNMYEGRKRVLLIAASILAARKLAMYEGGTRVPATVSAIADAVRWAELIMAEVDRRWPVRGQ
jgi:hypothetical protein